jgi:hypothetical protein
MKQLKRTPPPGKDVDVVVPTPPAAPTRKRKAAEDI